MKYNECMCIRIRKKEWAGDLVLLIDLLRVELQLPGYQDSFSTCGPSTKLAQHLERRDLGFNKFDTTCKEHDIVYSKYSGSINRAKLDKELAERAPEYVKSNDVSLGEKSAAWAVFNIKKAKSKIVGCLKKNKKVLKKGLQYIKGKCLYLSAYKKIGTGLKKKVYGYLILYIMLFM